MKGGMQKLLSSVMNVLLANTRLMVIEARQSEDAGRLASWNPLVDLADFSPLAITAKIWR